MPHDENKKSQRPAAQQPGFQPNRAPATMNSANALPKNGQPAPGAPSPNGPPGAAPSHEGGAPYTYNNSRKGQQRPPHGRPSYHHNTTGHAHHAHPQGIPAMGAMGGTVPTGGVPAPGAAPYGGIPGAAPGGGPRGPGGIRPPATVRNAHSRNGSFQQPYEQYYYPGNMAFQYPPTYAPMPQGATYMPPQSSPETVEKFKSQLKARTNHVNVAPAAPAASAAIPEVDKPKADNDLVEKLRRQIAERMKSAKSEAKPAAPKAEAKPEAKPEVKSEAKEVKPEAKPEVKEAKPEVKPEVKEVKPEAKPEPKVEPKVEAKPEAKVEAKPEPKEVVSEPKAEPKVEPKVEPKAEQPKVEAKPEPKVEPKVEPKPEAKVEAKPEPKEEPKPEPKVEAKVEAKEEPKLEAKVEEPKLEDKPEAKEEADKEEKKDEPKPIGKWMPTFMRDPSLKAKAEAKAEAETEKAKTASRAAAASAPKEDLEAKEYIEKFTKNLAAARPLTAKEQAEHQYPEGTTANALVSKDEENKFVYSVDFMGQFSMKIPRMYYEEYRKTLSMEYPPQVGRWAAFLSNRAMSARGGSRAGGHMGYSSGKGRGSQSGSGSMRGRNGSRRKGDRNGTRRNERNEETTGIPVSELPPLHTVENAWVPSYKRKAEEKQPEEDDGKLSPEEVQRKVKSLLNKLAWENFASVSKKIFDILLESAGDPNVLTLRQVVELTFDKAIDEPHFSAVYANLFYYFHERAAEMQDIVDETVPDKVVSGVVVLRRYMLSRSQEEFEKGWETANTDKPVKVMSDEYYAQVAAKRRGLGLIQFIGEMYKLSMISVRLLWRCFIILRKEEPTEEIVESTCRLIRTTAVPLLEREKVRLEAVRQEKAKSGKDGKAKPDENDITEGAVLDMAMNSIRKWRQLEELPPRLKFKIMDIEDLQANKWVGAEDNNGPKTIAQIHEEARAAAMNQEKEKARNARQGSRKFRR